MKYFDSMGRPVVLGSIIGRGGEGTVYEVDGGDCAAKIYHNHADDNKSRKLSAMVKLKDKRLLGISAWPLDTLHTVYRGPVHGILMPRITGYKNIHKLYSPKNRLLEFPNAGWDFLIHTSANLARAFSVIHEKGHVVGDVNYGNIAVSNKATIMLIDCDSFQIHSGSRIYTCGVGVSTHQPPELMALNSLEGIVRTPDHDNYGLAVLIFQLLFMGRHPFSWKFENFEEMQLEKSVMEKRFVYSLSGSDFYRMPPGVLTLMEVSPEIASLFERAFLNERRPSAKDWASALENLSKRLKVCSYDMSHKYFKGLDKCPWCRIEKATGVMLFSPLSGLYTCKKASQIETACRDIIDFSLSDFTVEIPNHVPIMIRPSTEYCKYSWYRRVCWAGAFTLIARVTLAVTGFEINILAVIAFFILSSSAVIYLNHIPDGIKEKVKKEYEQVYDNLRLHKAAWQQDYGEKKLKEKKCYLMEVVERYKSIDNERADKLKDLQFNRRKHQLQRYLRAFNISTSRIPCLSYSSRSMLKSNGIKTAVDIDNDRLNAIPGLYPGASACLARWRRHLEESFVFNPKRRAERDEIMEVEREILEKKKSLEEIILKGPMELRQVSRDIQCKRQLLMDKIRKGNRSLAQARANLWAVWVRAGML